MAGGSTAAVEKGLVAVGLKAGRVSLLPHSNLHHSTPKSRLFPSAWQQRNTRILMNRPLHIHSRKHLEKPRIC